MRCATHRKIPEITAFGYEYYSIRMRINKMSILSPRPPNVNPKPHFRSKTFQSRPSTDHYMSWMPFGKTVLILTEVRTFSFELRGETFVEFTTYSCRDTMVDGHCWFRDEDVSPYYTLVDLFIGFGVRVSLHYHMAYNNNNNNRQLFKNFPYNWLIGSADRVRYHTQWPSTSVE